MITVKQVEQSLRHRVEELGHKATEAMQKYRETHQRCKAAQEEYLNLREEQKLAQQALEIFLGAVESVPDVADDEDDREPTNLVCSDCGLPCCSLPCVHFDNEDGCTTPGCEGHNITRSEYERAQRARAKLEDR